MTVLYSIQKKINFTGSNKIETNKTINISLTPQSGAESEAQIGHAAGRRSAFGPRVVTRVQRDADALPCRLTRAQLPPASPSSQ